MAVVNTNVTIYQTLHHLEQLFWRSWIAWWIAIPTILFVTFNTITIRAIFKDGVWQSLLFPYLRNTVFRSIYHHPHFKCFISSKGVANIQWIPVWPTVDISYKFETSSTSYMICSLLSLNIHEISFMLIRVKTYTQNMAIVGDFDQTEA